MVVDERHLDVELGEFRLPVGAKVFVAEAAGDLEIAVEAGDHQELLVELGRLGQGVEMPGMKRLATRKSRAPFGCAAAQDRRFDLEETHVRHRPPHELREPVAEDERSPASPAGAGRGSDKSAAALRWARARASRRGESALRCR